MVAEDWVGHSASRFGASFSAAAKLLAVSVP